MNTKNKFLKEMDDFDIGSGITNYYIDISDASIEEKLHVQTLILELGFSWAFGIRKPNPQYCGKSTNGYIIRETQKTLRRSTGDFSGYRDLNYIHYTDFLNLMGGSLNESDDLDWIRHANPPTVMNFFIPGKKYLISKLGYGSHHQDMSYTFQKHVIDYNTHSYNDGRGAFLFEERQYLSPLYIETRLEELGLTLYDLLPNNIDESDGLEWIRDVNPIYGDDFYIDISGLDRKEKRQIQQIILDLGFKWEDRNTILNVALSPENKGYILKNETNGDKILYRSLQTKKEQEEQNIYTILEVDEFLKLINKTLD